MRSITSKGHKISIEEVNKIALTPFDNKRYYDDDDWLMVIIKLGKKKMRSSAPIHLCAVD